MNWIEYLLSQARLERKQDCLLQGQAQLDQRAVFCFSTIRLREAFKNKNDETYGIFYMLVDPPPLPTYGKFFRDFLLSKKDF